MAERNSGSIESAPSDDLRDVIEALRASNVEYEALHDEESHRVGRLVIKLPDGAEGLRVVLTPASSASLRRVDFAELFAVAPFEAIYYRPAKRLEATISTRPMPLSMLARRIPGMTTSENAEHESMLYVGQNYRASMSVSGDRYTISMSDATDMYHALLSRHRRIVFTVKLEGIDLVKPSHALEALDTYIKSFFFDLDARYNIPLQLRERRDTAYRPISDISRDPPSFPKNMYASGALELYMYGRAARSLPLLEFLAYYQAIEYFFPVFARRETIQRVRATMRDPRFNVGDDLHISRVIEHAAAAGTRGSSERIQLRDTVRACIDSGFVEDFVRRDDAIQKHFTHKEQAVQGVRRLILHEGQPDYRDQVADRVYDIRCRVVHTKGDGGAEGLELLLPSSPEAHALRYDIDLLREIARRVIISQSEALDAT